MVTFLSMNRLSSLKDTQKDAVGLSSAPATIVSVTAGVLPESDLRGIKKTAQGIICSDSPLRQVTFIFVDLFPLIRINVHISC
jgi:hypothetical protein